MRPIADCPDATLLARLVSGAEPAVDDPRLDDHLAFCERCSRRLDELIGLDESLSSTLKKLSASEPTAEPALGQVVEELKNQAGCADAPIVSEAEPLDFLSPPTEPGSLGRLGHYTVLEVVGRGGMGIVLKSFDSSLRRVVAIKVLARHLAESGTARRRFVREAQAAAAVSHDHVVTIHAVEAAANPPYLVMQFIEGKSLDERNNQSGPLEPAEILRIGMQTAAGLAAAHAQGLVHRDIKPANILLENGIERVKITDFGLARAVDDATLTQSGYTAGTPLYMAPEQARGEAVDHRADLFSLGSVMYAMCTGRPPFRAEGVMAVLKRVCDDAPRSVREVNPQVPEPLAQVVERLLAKDPAGRFQSAAEVAGELGEHLARWQQPARANEHAQTAAPSGGRPPWSRRGTIVLAAMLLLAVGLGLTESTGATALVPTVIRLVRGEGTLVLEIDDPQVNVLVDGEEVVIRGAGPHEVRLTSGSHRVETRKDGRNIHGELLTIARGDRQIVRVRHERSVATGTAKGRESAPDDGIADIRPVQTLRVGSNGAWSVAASPDGKLLLATGAEGASDGVVRFWDSETFAQRGLISSERGIRRAAFSADNRLLALAQEDGRASVRLTANGDEERALLGHNGEVRDVAISRDGKLVVSAAADKIVRVFDVESRRLLHALTGATEPLECVAISPDARWVAAGGDDRHVRLWDLSSGKLKWEVPGLVGGVDSQRGGPSPDGRITGVAFSPDGKTVAASSMDNLVYLWSTETGVVQSILKGHTSGVTSVSFSADGRRLATACWDGSAFVWDLATRRPVAEFNGRANQCFGAVLFDEGRQLATAHRDGQVMIWTVEAAGQGSGVRGQESGSRQ